MTPTYPRPPVVTQPPDPKKLAAIRDLALQLIGTDRGRDAWLARANPELGGLSPNDLIAAGKADVVERYIEANLNGDFG